MNQYPIHHQRQEGSIITIEDKIKLYSDAELMQLVRQKHRPALEELYDRYVKLVYSYAIKSTQDQQTSRSIVQRVFTRIWTTEKGYDPAKGQFVNWIITITRNISIDILRKKKRDQVWVTLSSEEMEQMADPFQHDPVEAVSRKMLREQIQKASQTLSKNQQELLEFLYWKGYSLSEIASMKNEPIGTIKSRLHQTLKILRKQLVLREEG